MEPNEKSDEEWDKFENKGMGKKHIIQKAI